MRGQLERLEGFPELTADVTRQLLYRIISSEQQKRLEIDRQLDLSYSIPGLARFRVNIYSQRESLAGAFRMIPAELKSLEELGLPTDLYELCRKPRGLVLVTGPTGSGKSTTLAALIDEINRTRAEHIITIEDPIEFLHRHKRCIVNQRELGPDATTFAEALRGALRQDPDVILLGEMRDLETISTALTAAETGHLVFRNAPHPGRRVHGRPRDRRLPGRPAGPDPDAARGTLEGVIAQTLLPTADGQGRVAAVEVLFARRRRAKPHPPGQDRAGLLDHADRRQAKGMHTMEQALAELVLRGVITEEVALRDPPRPSSSSGFSAAPSSRAASCPPAA